MASKEDWIECRLGDILTLKRGYDLPRKERIPGSIPIVSSSGVTGFHQEAKVKGPGVVTGRYGTLGKAYYVPGDFWPLNTSLYVTDFKGNDRRFIYYFLQSQGLERQNVAGAVPGVNRNYLHQLPVRVPPLSTQRKITAILSAYDDLIQNNTRRIQILEEMAQAIYRQWFVEFKFPLHEDVPRIDSGTELGEIPEGWEVQPFSNLVIINPKLAVDKRVKKPYVGMNALSIDSMLIDLGLVEMKTGSSGAKFQNRDVLFPRITPSVENGKAGFVQFLDEGQIAIGSTEIIVFREKELNPEYIYFLSREPALF
jgi:type I restriction enzyme S subunit